MSDKLYKALFLCAMAAAAWALVLLGAWYVAAAPPRTCLARPPHYKARLVVEVAKALSDVRYRRGGDLRWGRRTDCSGYVQHVYRLAGIPLPRGSYAQSRFGKVVARRFDLKAMKPGDLLFFRTRKRRIGHVGIYLGEGLMIHCTRPKVRITVLEGSRYQRTLVRVVRVIF